MLQEKVEEFKRRVAWFEKQLFGQKSEKRRDIDITQLSLLGDFSVPVTAPEGEKEHISYTRSGRMIASTTAACALATACR